MAPWKACRTGRILNLSCVIGHDSRQSARLHSVKGRHVVEIRNHADLGQFGADITGVIEAMGLPRCSRTRKSPTARDCFSNNIVQFPGLIGGVHRYERQPCHGRRKFENCPLGRVFWPPDGDPLAGGKICAEEARLAHRGREQLVIRPGAAHGAVGARFDKPGESASRAQHPTERSTVVGRTWSSVARKIRIGEIDRIHASPSERSWNSQLAPKTIAKHRRMRRAFEKLDSRAVCAPRTGLTAVTFRARATAWAYRPV